MPRHANYMEGTDSDAADRTSRDIFSDVIMEDPFDDPEVRRRIAELIARSARKEKKSQA
jgi:hypothetical protein